MLIIAGTSDASTIDRDIQHAQSSNVYYCIQKFKFRKLFLTKKVGTPSFSSIDQIEINPYFFS